MAKITPRVAQPGPVPVSPLSLQLVSLYPFPPFQSFQMALDSCSMSVLPDVPCKEAWTEEMDTAI